MNIQIQKSSATGKLNLTPMIDCVFLLLIFFLVATKFEEEERSLDVVLPQSSEAMPLTAKPKEIFVNVDAQGQISVRSQEMRREELLTLLQQAWANNPGRQSVIIRADERCPVRHIVAVMDACNKANIRDYKLATAQQSAQ